MVAYIFASKWTRRSSGRLALTAVLSATLAGLGAIGPSTSALATGRPADSRKPSHKATIETVRAEAPATRMAIISLADQHIEVFEANGRVERSRVSTGMAGHGTPTGVFSILQRNRYHESNLYSNAPMPYMQRLTWSGIALHEGYVPRYRASHGCIRLPRSFAASLWRIGYMGMRVIVSPHRVRPVDFAHPRLPQPITTPPRQLATLVRVADAAGETAAASPASVPLTPYEAAQQRLAVAVASKTATGKAVRPALENATAKSREAHQAATALKASAGILADAEEHLELEQLAMATVQTESAEAAVLTRIRFATAGVAAARTSHEKLKQLEQSASAEAFAAAHAAREAQTASEQAVEELQLARKAVAPFTVFISRATGQLYIRQGFYEIYNAPIVIREPDKPLGTHVFTATAEAGAGAIRWTAVTVPTSGGQSHRKRGENSAPQSSAAEALDRIELPADVRRLLGERLWPGASIIVSDYGLGETNEGTGFVIVTR